MRNRRSLSLLLDDRPVELGAVHDRGIAVGAEEPPLPDQLLEVLEDLLPRGHEGLSSPHDFWSLITGGRV